MCKCLWMFLAPVVFLIAGSYYLIHFKSPPPLPHFDLDEWWGPKDLANTKQDASIRPFKIEFDEKTVKDLRQRLKNHRKLTPPLEGIAFEYGFNSNQLDDWVDYWSNKYDFKAREAALNKYPQFKTKIQGLDIHFIRVTPKNTKKDVVPLLLLHGWPGSVREFYESIPILTAESKDRDFVLELIIPSIPGYGFSEAAARPGLGPPQIAVIFRNLMHRLGYKEFFVQGGDAGAVIATSMVTLFPKEISGFHCNMPFSQAPSTTFLTLLGTIFPSLVVESQYKERMYPLGSKYAFLIEESGYTHIQATKPDTIGIAVNESPVSLLTYILEKFSTWTDKEHKSLPDGGLSKYSKDQLIDNLMIYWTSNSITTSFRLYAESLNSRTMGYQLDSIPSPVPTWILQAKNELLYLPSVVLRLKFPNLVKASHFENGGHFLALELPKEFSEDVLEAVTQIRNVKTVKTEL